MLTAFGSFRGTGGPSGQSIFTFGGVRKLGDEMYDSFHRVGEDSEEGDHQNRQSDRSYPGLLDLLGKCPWLLQQYPLVLFGMMVRYPWMFTPQTLEDNGYTHTLH